MGRLRTFPLRKFLACVATVVWITVVTLKLTLSDTDIPVNVYNLIWSMCGAIYGGYFGTSVWEAVRAPIRRYDYADRRGEDEGERRGG
jgi:hypothetical protein